MKDYAFIKFGNRIIFANHAGLSNVPQYANILSRYVYQNGDGNFSHDVDLSYSENENHKNHVNTKIASFYSAQAVDNFYMTTIK